MELAPQISWDACFNPDPFELSAAYYLPDSSVDLVIDSLSSESFNVCSQSARILALGTPSDVSRLSVSSTACEDGLRDIHGEKDAAAGSDFLPKSVDSASTASAAPTSPNSYPFHIERGTPGAVSRLPQQWHSLPRTSTPALVREQTHDRKVRRKRTSSRCSSSKVNPKTKAAHSVVERRYRDKLNDKMMELHLTLASSKLMAPTLGESTVPGDLSQIVGKIGKAGIITNAINYVNQAELQLRHLSNEIEELRSRVLDLETLLPQASESFRSHLLAAF